MSVAPYEGEDAEAVNRLIAEYFLRLDPFPSGYSMAYWFFQNAAGADKGPRQAK